MKMNGLSCIRQAQYGEGINFGSYALLEIREIAYIIKLSLSSFFVQQTDKIGLWAFSSFAFNKGKADFTAQS